MIRTIEPVFSFPTATERVYTIPNDFINNLINLVEILRRFPCLLPFLSFQMAWITTWNTYLKRNVVVLSQIYISAKANTSQQLFVYWVCRRFLLNSSKFLWNKGIWKTNCLWILKEQSKETSVCSRLAKNKFAKEIFLFEKITIFHLLRVEPFYVIGLSRTTMNFHIILWI